MDLSAMEPGDEHDLKGSPTWKEDLDGVPNTSLGFSDDDDDDLVPDISNAVEDESTTGSSEPPDEDLTVGLSLAECVEKANAHKAEGNEHFKALRSCEAVACYGLGTLTPTATLALGFTRLVTLTHHHHHPPPPPTTTTHHHPPQPTTTHHSPPPTTTQITGRDSFSAGGP